MDILQGSDKDKETRGDVMIQVLWDRQADAIISIKLGDAEANYYKYEPMEAIRSRWETIKKDKNGKNCHNQHKHFTPFFLSVDGVLGREAPVVLARLIQTLKDKNGRTNFARTGSDKTG